MIPVKVPKDKSKYGFTFRYYPETSGQPIECRIMKDGELLANGVASLYYTDTYNKFFGRRMAFLYAVYNAKFSRQTRTFFWKAFIKQCRLA